MTVLTDSRYVPGGSQPVVGRGAFGAGCLGVEAVMLWILFLGSDSREKLKSCYFLASRLGATSAV